MRHKKNEGRYTTLLLLPRQKIGTYLVRRNGMMMPAPVATNNKITWSTVSKTLINFTTSALALELSKPSKVTYCCCCRAWCSIFWICNWTNEYYNLLCIQRLTCFCVHMTIRLTIPKIHHCDQHPLISNRSWIYAKRTHTKDTSPWYIDDTWQITHMKNILFLHHVWEWAVIWSTHSRKGQTCKSRYSRACSSIDD